MFFYSLSILLLQNYNQGPQFRFCICKCNPIDLVDFYCFSIQNTVNSESSFPEGDLLEKVIFEAINKHSIKQLSSFLLPICMLHDEIQEDYIFGRKTVTKRP